MVREHKRPGGDGHELPGKQEAEAIVGKHDEVHAGDKQGIEGEDTAGRGLVPTMADGKEAGAGTPQIHHQKEECRERIQAKMGAGPRQPEGQAQALCWGGMQREVVAARAQNAETSARLMPYVRAVARRDRCSNAAATAVPSRTATPPSAIPTCIRPRFPRPDL